MLPTAGRATSRLQRASDGPCGRGRGDRTLRAAGPLVRATLERSLPCPTATEQRQTVTNYVRIKSADIETSSFKGFLFFLHV